MQKRARVSTKMPNAKCQMPNNGSKQKKQDDDQNQEEANNTEDDEFNPTLAAMETEIKPKVLQTVHNLTKEYNKLIKYQKEKLLCVLSSTKFSTSKEKSGQ